MSRSSITKNMQLDPISEDGRDTDIVIPVIGATGAGKSTFINHLFGDGKEHVRVGHDLTPCTANITPIIIPSVNQNPTNPNLQSSRIIMLDTPGFDNTLESDAEILKRIAD
ncbi:hypothetical protein K435DRAFT_867062 [Dendrothele bispora CBS 962.96]|uniref:G domain-containing protein n=1 Tax=Dendrothele bispora (strain CBS 962.96) TaxID=1314807 RepID=A0A4S8LFD5_DENBC|nr:hypothetical protein K435DRAFT_867062 [Dendrothele bispora CBS 962.96]